MATKLAQGQPLDSVLLKRIASEVAEGLHALHQLEIIQRELTPTGILISNEGPAVLTDFELAKLLDGSPSVSSGWNDNPYRAPEVCEANLNAQADIYSWARIVTHCALGTLPVAAREAEELAKCKMPSAVRSLLIGCLEIRKSCRPLSMAEVLPVLKRWR